MEPLKEGEVICNKCNGKGQYSYSDSVAIWCSKCQGEGKLDWISNAMNKEAGVKIWGQTPPLKMCKFKGVITINTIEGVSGTVYPIGTVSKPVNNIADAKIIAKERGLYDK